MAIQLFTKSHNSMEMEMTESDALRLSQRLIGLVRGDGDVPTSVVYSPAGTDEPAVLVSLLIRIVENGV
jgi:hypothetical protein